MSNELQKQSLPFNEIMSIGKAFAESGMFPDIKSAAQAVVKIQAGQEMGIAPFAAMSGIHIILGKPVPGAGIIASKVKSSGKYNYKMKEHSDKICSIDFYEGSEKIGNSTFTIEEAKKAQTKNTDKFPKNMLFARAISNGQKWFCPDVFLCAVYTDEEFESVTEDVKHEEVTEEISAIETQVRTKYNNAVDIELILDSCEKIEQIRNLYAMNNTVIEANPELKAKFTARKEKIQKPVTP